MDRTSEPLYSSESMGQSYKYWSDQLIKKGKKHIPDFGFPVDGKTSEQIAFKYKDVIEQVLLKPNLVIHETGTFNKLESTINMGDPETLAIVGFERNPLYKNYHFISSYPLSEKAFASFVETGNIGISLEERAMKSKIKAKTVKKYVSGSLRNKKSYCKDII